MRIENGQINLSSSHDFNMSSEVRAEKHVHNKIETHDGDVYEYEATYHAVGFDQQGRAEYEIDSAALSAMSAMASRAIGQGISISTRESFRASDSVADAGTAQNTEQVSATVSRHYARMNVDAEFSHISLNQSTGAAMIRDMQAEFMIRIMEMGLGRSLKEMSPEELGQMGLSEDNIMRIRGYFNDQDARRAQHQADLNRVKGMEWASDQDMNKRSVMEADNPSDTDVSQGVYIPPGSSDGISQDIPVSENTERDSVSSYETTLTSGSSSSGVENTDESAPLVAATSGEETAEPVQDYVPAGGTSEGIEEDNKEAAVPGATVPEDISDVGIGVTPQYDNQEEEEPIPPGMVRQTTTITESRQSIFREEEHTRFSAHGKVLTSDGREIDIELDVGMSRLFESTELAESIRVMKDPLVVNFDGPAVALDNQRTFMFDIDMDGEEDQLAQLQSGSGFLALDKNGDGVINDGSELFGAASGNGFADLAEYDEDGDGFIDEDDSVFNKLRIWVPGDDGESELFALLDKDVGAIHLNHVSTEFALNRVADNENMGYVRSSGVFLKESGGVGSVQQIDLAV
ncbi:hypothetical protein [Oceanospirillum sediminis]|uniref:EF-hand domain-containing protein n=1 Tax=Oceanospirillum sediminis TaxID=2760088 RepID=A0A839IND1_9GAMM|nr:hypothetical protein [Oceanospirillum sediminis]MBB1486022.1 hypothetical protein [Oceanospirillum sediminis]